jgi:uridine phosphorylase
VQVRLATTRRGDEDGGVPFPSLPNKHGLKSAYPPSVFLDALREAGWEPGPVPDSVVYTYARFELYLATRPDRYTANHMLGTGPGRFFLVNATNGRVGVNCLGIGAPAAVAQLELQAELGVRRCISIGTAGGLQVAQQPGQIVVVSSAVRDEGTSYHYLAPDEKAAPDTALTARYSTALGSAGIAHVSGPTLTTDAPHRTTPEEIRHHRANGVQTVDMEAAALFALGRVRRLSVASAVVVDGVADDEAASWRLDLPHADEVLRQLFAATADFLAAES